MVRRSHSLSVLVLVGSAIAQTAFQSSNGRFTAQVPPGWNIVEVEKSFRLVAKNSSGTGAGADDNTHKIKLLQEACASGVLTREECAAKMAALSGNPVPSPRAQGGSQGPSPQAASAGRGDGRVGTTLHPDPGGRFSA